MKKELFEEGEELAETLIRIGFTDEQIIMIVLLLETQEEKGRLNHWLKDNMTATQGEILEQAILFMEN